MSYYTGIVEIDSVLLDLYEEQVRLEERLHKKPNSRDLSVRHRKVVGLISGLLVMGRFLQSCSAEPDAA